MACDHCTRLQMDLSEARLKILHLESVVTSLKESRTETIALNKSTADHIAKARQSLAEARVIIDAAREQNQRTKEMLERLRTYETERIIHEGDD